MRLIDHIARYFDLNSRPDAKIDYVEGDATRPQGFGNRLIIHCCNDIGGWGAGFVLALNKRDIEPESVYRAWHKICKEYRIDGKEKSTGKFELGEVQFSEFAEPTLFVANMIGQHKTGKDEDGNPPIRYCAIRKALRKVRRYARKHNMTVHAPRFGSDLAGGDWNVIEKIIEEELTTRGISVTVYDWKG
jgi:hypothetical protein